MAKYHVTRITNGDAYGHDIEHCDEGGCSGSDMFLGKAIGDDSKGIIVESVLRLDEAGNQTWELLREG